MNDVNKCSHSQDVVVTCSGSSNYTTSGNYRLANPKNITSRSGALLGVWGRIEYFNKYYFWNQICDYKFTMENAVVICRSLGLPINDV